MRRIESRVFETLLQVQSFLDRNDAQMAEVNQSSVRETVDEVVAALTTHATDQRTGLAARRSETQRQRQLQAALRTQHLDIIAAIARLRMPNSADLEALTPPVRKLKGQHLVAAAHAVAEAVLPHTQVFIGAGRPADFVDQLRAAAAAVTDSMVTRADELGRQVGGTAGVVTEVSHTRRLIRDIGRIIRPILATNDPLRADWEAIRRGKREAGFGKREADFGKREAGSGKREAGTCR